MEPLCNGDDHVALMESRLTLPSPARPFTIGQIDPRKGFVHVLDDTTLDVLLRTLDTVKDFVEYLVRKERFITAGKLGFAAGEEDLLAYYLRQIGPDGWYDFILPRGMHFIGIDEGLWLNYQQHPQRLAQLQADEISYQWDGLIARSNQNILNGTQYETTGGSVAHSERLVRFLAREPRTRRRLLTNAFVDLYQRLGTQSWKVRVIEPFSPGDPYYLFLAMRHPDSVSYQDYRRTRRHCLEEYLQAMKIRYPEAKDIVGIGTGPPDDEDSAEDLLYLDAREWTEEHQRAAERLQQETGFLTRITHREGKFKTYPRRRQSIVSEWATWANAISCHIGSGDTLEP